MKPFLLLTGVMGALTVTWLTRPLWQPQPTEAPARVGEVAPPLSRRPVVLIASVAALVLAVLGLGLAMVGAPADLKVEPAAAAAPVSPSRVAADGALQQAQSRISATIAGLTERLQAHPDDADGWQTLARSHAALGHHAQAIDAFKKALELRPDDPTLLTEYAFSAAVRDPYAASGEPARMIERALELDPRNPKALALAGTLALDRKDYVAAIGHWELLAQIEPPDSAIGKQLQFSILQARQLGGLREGAMVNSNPAATAAGGSAGAQVGGLLTLAPSLAAKVAPQDTVYIYARPATGSRMPLAVLRKQVKDLPLRFTLDDSVAVSANATLSKAQSIVVGARIARAGTAEARDGDLRAMPRPAVLGQQDLAVEINEVVRGR
jgi:cytochrome c-type biogenesis protein CcmH